MPRASFGSCFAAVLRHVRSGIDRKPRRSRINGRHRTRTLGSESEVRRYKCSGSKRVTTNGTPALPILNWKRSGTCCAAINVFLTWFDALASRHKLGPVLFTRIINHVSRRFFIWNHPFLRGTVRRAILIVRHVFRWADASLFENLADAFRHMYRCVWDVGGEEHATSKIEESLTAEASIYSSQTNVRRRATRAAKKCLSVDALLFLMLPFVASRIS